MLLTVHGEKRSSASLVCYEKLFQASYSSVSTQYSTSSNTAEEIHIQIWTQQRLLVSSVFKKCSVCFCIGNIMQQNVDHSLLNIIHLLTEMIRYFDLGGNVGKLASKILNKSEGSMRN